MYFKDIPELVHQNAGCTFQSSPLGTIFTYFDHDAIAQNIFEMLL